MRISHNAMRLFSRLIRLPVVEHTFENYKFYIWGTVQNTNEEHEA